MTQDNGISIGVLIIGSLYWDPSDNRQNWRSERLNLGTKKYVSAPIRYGRRSKCRGNSYTMVFSMNLCEEQFGRAIVVPCKQRVKSICDLLEEAKFLWMAESGHLGPISAKWGCVAVVENPDRPIPDDLREGWAERVSRESCYGQLKWAHSRFPGAVCRQRWTVRLGEVELVFGQTGRMVLDITARDAHDGALKWTTAPSTPRAARSI